GVLAVVDEADVEAKGLLEGVDIAVDRAGAPAFDDALGVAVADGGAEDAAAGNLSVRECLVGREAEAAVAGEIVATEGLPDVARLQLLAGLVGDALDHLAELDLQAARQAQPVALLEDVGDAALAGLAVDADDSLIGAAEIGWVDRQIGHFPEAAVALRPGGEALLDGVLMRAGEGREHQLAGIRMARIDRQLVAVLERADDLVDVAD